MEQMADLLAAEQAELDQTQRTIIALENQLTISTSTHLLPRHERLFALPVNTTESPVIASRFKNDVLNAARQKLIPSGAWLNWLEPSK